MSEPDGLEEKRRKLRKVSAVFSDIQYHRESLYSRWLETSLIKAREELENAEKEIKRIKTWTGIMSVIDEYYPEDIFTENCKDPGCQVIWALRKLDKARERIKELKKEANMYYEDEHGYERYSKEELESPE